MTADVPRYVVDASVAMKWYLEDETHTGQADAVLADFGEGRVNLLAPIHIHYEVTNALQTAARRGRIPESLARAAAVEFLQLDLSLVVGTHMIMRGWDVAQTYGCATYDGIYLAVAEMTDTYLLHADRRLHNTLGGRFPLELWIEDLVF